MTQVTVVYHNILGKKITKKASSMHEAIMIFYPTFRVRQWADAYVESFNEVIYGTPKQVGPK